MVFLLCALICIFKARLVVYELSHLVHFCGEHCSPILSGNALNLKMSIVSLKVTARRDAFDLVKDLFGFLRIDLMYNLLVVVGFRIFCFERIDFRDRGTFPDGEDS